MFRAGVDPLRFAVLASRKPDVAIHGGCVRTVLVRTPRPMRMRAHFVVGRDDRGRLQKLVRTLVPV
jgi:hypothetical protein